MEISSANSAERVAAADLAGVAHIDDEPAPSIAGGNQRLPLALAESLGSAVRLDSPVSAVEWGERVRVLTPGGELDADACVIAVPASVLDRIAFDPPLPAEVAEPLAQITYGHAAKLFVPLRRPAEPSAVMNVPERYWSWTATGEGGHTQPVVSAFAGSTAGARRTRGRGRARSAGSTRSSALRGDLDLDRDGALLSTWADDPWVGAAYSTSPPPSVAEAVEEPTGPLAFAGEHTAGPYAALMEGAIRSGQRAARSLLHRAHA